MPLPEPWNRRRLALDATLQVWSGGARVDWTADVRQGRVRWDDEFRLPVAEARAAVILSHAHADQSVLMAWAVTGLAGSAVIAVNEALPAYVPACTEPEAADLAARAAAGCGCAFVLQSAAVNSTLYLAISELRPGPTALVADAHGHCAALLELAMSAAQEPGPQTSRTLASYARGLQQLAALPSWSATDPNLDLLKFSAHLASAAASTGEARHALLVQLGDRLPRPSREA
jgi:hypothetical protein